MNETADRNQEHEKLVLYAEALVGGCGAFIADQPDRPIKGANAAEAVGMAAELIVLVGQKFSDRFVKEAKKE